MESRRLTVRRAAAAAVALVLAAQAAVLALSRRVDFRVVERNLSSLPMELERWRGEDRRFDAEVYQVLQTDDDLLRLYSGDAGAHWLYIGYYGTKKGGRTGHLPEYCYPGTGWTLESQGKAWVPVDGGPPARVNHLVFRKRNVRSSVLYWTQSGPDRVSDSGWKMNFARVARRLRDFRDDGAFVRITSPVTGSLDEVLARQTDFAAAVLRELPAAWPRERPS